MDDKQPSDQLPILPSNDAELDAKVEQAMQEELTAFLQARKSVVAEYMTANPRKRLPIAYDNTGKPRWMNRAERRAKGMR